MALLQSLVDNKRKNKALFKKLKIAKNKIVGEEYGK